jgi:hypothetical protein
MVSDLKDVESEYTTFFVIESKPIEMGDTIQALTLADDETPFF